MTTAFEWGHAQHFMSDGYVPLGDHVAPSRIRLTGHGGDRRADLEIDFEVVDGAPRCSRLVLYAPDDGQVTQDDLRSINVGHLMRTTFAATAMVPDPGGGSASAPDEVTPLYARGVDRSVTAASRKPRRLTPDFLAKVAAVYNAHPGQPTTAVQNAFGGGYRTAAGYVQRCRKDGLLPATTPGKKS